MVASEVLKVSVTIEVPIDLTLWEANYATGETPTEIRAVVKETADELVKAHFDRVGVLHRAVT